MADLEITGAEVTREPCQVYVNGVKLGGVTEGGVRIEVAPITGEDRGDDGGERLNFYHFGTDVQVVCPFNQENIDVLAQFFPGGETSSGYRYFGGHAPLSAQSDGVNLKLRPISRVATADASRDAEFYKALPVASAPIGWTRTGHRIFEVTFYCVRDTDRAAGYQIGSIQVAT